RRCGGSRRRRNGELRVSARRQRRVGHDLNRRRRGRRRRRDDRQARRREGRDRTVHHRLLGVILAAVDLRQVRAETTSGVGRISTLMTPVFTTLPVTLAKLFAPTSTVWVPLVTATVPVRT